MGFLDEINEPIISEKSLGEILSVKNTDDDFEATVTDEFDAYIFLETNKIINMSPNYKNNIKTQVSVLQLENQIASYALLKDLFNIFLNKETEIKKSKTTNVAQLFNRDILKMVQKTNSFQYIKEKISDNNAKSFVVAVNLLKNILDSIQKSIENNYEDAAKEAQSLYDEDSEDNKDKIDSPETGNEGEDGNEGNDNTGDDKGELGNNSKSGENDFDSLPQDVKDVLEKAKAKMGNSIANAMDKEIKEKVENAEKILITLGYGSQSNKAFIDRKLIEQIKLYDDLMNNKNLLRIVNILGQIQRRNQERWDNIKTSKHVKLIEISLGDDITNLISEELFSLTDDLLELELMSRLQEDAALIYKSKPKASWKGPIIFCIDESGSMDGIKNIKAKSIALAMMDIALKQKREFATVHFDANVSDVYIIEKVDKGKSLDSLLEIAGHFSGGGTDFNKPLEKALSLIDTSKFLHSADIVFITDGQAADLSLKNLETLNALRREKKLKIITLLIDESNLFKNPPRNSIYSSYNNDKSLPKNSDKFLIINDLLEAEEDIFDISVS